MGTQKSVKEKGVPGAEGEQKQTAGKKRGRPRKYPVGTPHMSGFGYREKNGETIDADKAMSMVEAERIKQGLPVPGEGTVGAAVANRLSLQNTLAKTAGSGNILTPLVQIFCMPVIDSHNAEQVRERICLYIQLALENETRPTVAGMAMALGISREMMWQIKEGGIYRPPEVVDAIKKAYAFIGSALEDWMSTGKINPVSGIFLMKQIGYTDTKETVIRHDTGNHGKSDAELEKEYLDSIPVVVD